MYNRLSETRYADRTILLSKNSPEQQIAYHDTTSGFFGLIKDLFQHSGPIPFNPILVGESGVGKTTMVRKLKVSRICLFILIYFNVCLELLI